MNFILSAILVKLIDPFFMIPLAITMFLAFKLCGRGKRAVAIFVCIAISVVISVTATSYLNKPSVRAKWAMGEREFYRVTGGFNPFDELKDEKFSFVGPDYYDEFVSVFNEKAFRVVLANVRTTQENNIILDRAWGGQRPGYLRFVMAFFAGVIAAGLFSLIGRLWSLKN